MISAWLLASERIQPNAKHADSDSDSDSDSKKEIEELNNHLKIDMYDEKGFLVNWNEVRRAFLDTSCDLKKLSKHDRDLFQSVKLSYNKEDFHKALRGLFKQEKIPRDIMWIQPKHFLDNMGTYIDAENNNKYKLYV